LIKVDFEAQLNQLTFAKEAEDMPAYAMVQMMEASANMPLSPLAANAVAEMPRAAAKGRRTLAG
jgi:hypothetical protein